MGCIEITPIYLLFALVHRLIETWDVLKFFCVVVTPMFPNGLIETWDVLKYGINIHFRAYKSINRNMGCIEI